MNKERLLNVAKALREANIHKALVDCFSMDSWGWAEDSGELWETLNGMFGQTDDDGNEIMGEKADRIADGVQQAFAENLIPHGCAAPSCALGHYALRTDLQSDFELRYDGEIIDANDESVDINDSFVREHFGIDVVEESRLFGVKGCGNARCPLEAAEYIEKFVEEKENVKAT